MSKPRTMKGIVSWLRSVPCVFGYGETRDLADRIERAAKAREAKITEALTDECRRLRCDRERLKAYVGELCDCLEETDGESFKSLIANAREAIA